MVIIYLLCVRFPRARDEEMSLRVCAKALLVRARCVRTFCREYVGMVTVYHVLCDFRAHTHTMQHL